MKKYNIDWKSHFRHLWLLIFITIFLPIGTYYLAELRSNDYSVNEVITVILVTLLVFVIPSLLLHIRYYLHNKSDRFEIDNMNKNYLFHSESKGLKFTSEDIESFYCYKSRPLAEERLGIFPWDSYNYSKITLKDGQVIKVSSLLVNELDKIIKFDEVEIKKTLYAWIK